MPIAPSKCWPAIPTLLPHRLVRFWPFRSILNRRKGRRKGTANLRLRSSDAICASRSVAVSAAGRFPGASTHPRSSRANLLACGFPHCSFSRRAEAQHVPQSRTGEAPTAARRLPSSHRPQLNSGALILLLCSACAMYGGTQSALLYSGQLRLVFTLISCIYGWLFAGLMNVSPRQRCVRPSTGGRLPVVVNACLLAARRMTGLQLRAAGGAAAQAHRRREGQDQNLQSVDAGTCALRSLSGLLGCCPQSPCCRAD